MALNRIVTDLGELTGELEQVRVEGLPESLTAKADDDAVVKLAGAQTIVDPKNFTSPVSTPTVDHGTQGGTIEAPTPQTLWQQQPRDPAFGPWHCHSGGQYFGSTYDPVLYFGYNSHFAPNHNPDEPSCTLNHEVNYFEEATGKTTFEAYSEFLSADETLRVRPWMFTLDKATGANRFAINIGPKDDYGFFRVTSQDTYLLQITGGGISPDAADTIATLSWSSLETFNYTADSLQSTLTLKGTPAKLHLDHGNSIVQWSNQWNVNINNADNLLYVRDMLNSRNHVVYTGASTSAVALTTFNSRVVANGQVTIINGAPASFAARGKLFGFGPSTQPVDNYTSYLSFSASSSAIACTVNFDLCDGTATGHVTPLSLRGDNSVLFPGTAISTGGFSGPGSGLTGIPQSGVTNLVTNLAAKAPLASPALTGTPTAPTASPGTNNTQVATTAYCDAAVAAGGGGGGAVSSVFGRTGAVIAVSGDYAVADVTGAAPLASPTFTGTPAAPTATAGTNTTQVATTAFVASGLALKADLASPTFTGTVTAPFFVGDGSGLTNLPGGGGGSTLAFVATADKTVSNTTTETTLFGTGVGSLTIAANALTVGKTYRVKLVGLLGATSGSATLKVKVGGVTCWNSGALAMGVQAGQAFNAEATLTCRATGATSTVMTGVSSQLFTSATLSRTFSFGITSSAANVDTTIANDIDITLTFSAAAVGNTVTITNATVEALN